MPVYRYKCKQCRREFELLRNASNRDKETRCPRCGSSAVKRVFSLFGTVFPNTGCFPGDPRGSS